MSNEESDPRVDEGAVEEHAPVFEEEVAPKQKLISTPLLALFLVVIVVGAAVIGYRIINTSPAFVGDWQQGGNPDGLTYSFKKDKTGTVSLGEAKAEITWRQKGDTLVIAPVEDANELEYALTEAKWTVTKPEIANRDMLTLVIGSEEVKFLPAREKASFSAGGGGGAGTPQQGTDN